MLRANLVNLESRCLFSALRLHGRNILQKSGIRSRLLPTITIAPFLGTSNTSLPDDEQGPHDHPITYATHLGYNHRSGSQLAQKSMSRPVKHLHQERHFTPEEPSVHNYVPVNAHTSDLSEEEINPAELRTYSVPNRLRDDDDNSTRRSPPTYRIGPYFRMASMSRISV